MKYYFIQVALRRKFCGLETNSMEAQQDSEQVHSDGWLCFLVCLFGGGTEVAWYSSL
jgi:hypothetical protein